MTEIRCLTLDDIAAAQRLREQAGWNQTDADWRRLLTWSPDGCWVAERDGRVVGTTAVTAYGRRIAWIGMVLVGEAHRRQGIGRALLGHAIEHLDGLGIETIALDSTPEGQPLYASLGFADAFELARWRGPIPRSSRRATQGVPPDAASAGSAVIPSLRSGQALAASSQPSQSARRQSTGPSDVQDAPVIRPLTLADLPSVTAYDAQLFGTDRAHILDTLFGGHPDRCFVAERQAQISGYVLSRPGARAWHLGPLAADDPLTAERLARLALPPITDPLTGEMVMDVVMPNPDAVALTTALGLTQVRRFIRMTRGAPPPAIDTDHLYTSAGPELG